MANFTLNGQPTTVGDQHTSLLDALREECHVISAKDGCAPQGQCGCCTVLVNGKARVACVTPLRRIEGADVRTIEGLDPGRVAGIAAAMLSTGASQCGFCTPGIVVRAASAMDAGKLGTRAEVDRQLAAHACRCTGWQPIVEAMELAVSGAATAPVDPEAASARASLEGGVPQVIDEGSVLGRFAFAADRAPEHALVAVLREDGSYAVAETLAEARALASRVQGRNTTVPVTPPLELPVGFEVAFRTGFVELGYLEPDGAWCEPGADPVPFTSNGGGFGAKRASSAAADARRLADEHGRAVRVLWPREELARHGAKRPPLALGLDADGGLLRVARTPGAQLAGLEDLVAQLAPGVELELVDVAGPPVSMVLRGAVAVELLAAQAVLGAEGGAIEVAAGGRATVEVGEQVRVEVDGGDPLCATTLRSYVIGAVHQGLGLARHEGVAVDAQGHVLDLTFRSLGQLPASQVPEVAVSITGSGEPRPTSVAVMAATLASAWIADGRPADLPSLRTS